MEESGTTHIREFYNSRGTHALVSGQRLDFSLHLSAPYEFCREFIRHRIAVTSNPLRLLDFCCGCGVHAVHAARMGAQVHGVDISERSIQAARALAVEYGVQHACSFVLGDAVEVMKSRGPHDFIFVSGSLYYFDVGSALSAIHDSLAPEGVFLCIETNGSNKFMNLYRKIRNWKLRHRDSRTLNELISIQEFEAFAGLFREVDLRYFDLFTLFGGLLSRFPRLARYYHHKAQKIDAFLLNRAPFRWMAFKVVVIAKR